MEFPELKRTVRELAYLWKATLVLIEDKASGTQLIQELRADNFSLAQAAPAGDGDKVIRLRAQTAKIEGGFVLFPTAAPWLDIYLLELITFPNSKNDDQVDSTVNALAWSTQEATSTPNAWIYFYAKLARQAHGEKDEPAHAGRAQTEHDEDRQAMIEEMYQQVVNRRKPIRADRRCAWCGEEVGKSYVTDGVVVYHQEIDKDCYSLSLKHGKKCASGRADRPWAWCGEEVGEYYVTVGVVSFSRR